jgi:hypothetical protein
MGQPGNRAAASFQPFGGVKIVHKLVAKGDCMPILVHEQQIFFLDCLFSGRFVDSLCVTPVVLPLDARLQLSGQVIVQSKENVKQ